MKVLGDKFLLKVFKIFGGFWAFLKNIPSNLKPPVVTFLQLFCNLWLIFIPTSGHTGCDLISLFQSEIFFSQHLATLVVT